jgi:hypothetical protein
MEGYIRLLPKDQQWIPISSILPNSWLMEDGQTWPATSRLFLKNCYLYYASGEILFIGIACCKQSTTESFLELLTDAMLPIPPLILNLHPHLIGREGPTGSNRPFYARY